MEEEKPVNLELTSTNVSDGASSRIYRSLMCLYLFLHLNTMTAHAMVGRYNHYTPSASRGTTFALGVQW